MQLFSYNLPSILFYTLPISFLVAIIVTLLRLSNDNELIALFSLGLNAKAILHHYFLIGGLFSIVLLILSLGLMPKTEQQVKAFKHEKTTQAQININPSKLGQKFGDLFIYVKSKENNTLKDIVIYNKDKEHSAQLFIAKKASVQNNNLLITLTLNDGSGYTFSKEKLRKINYETMKVFRNLHSDAFTYSNIIQYWVKLSLNPKKKSFIFFFIFCSIIPLLALPIIASFSIINPRYQKNYAYHILAVTTIALYSLSIILQSSGTLLMTIGFSLFFLILGFYLYKHFVLRFF